MKAAFVTAVGQVEIRDIPKPDIKPDEVLIRVKTAGVCGSDLHLFHGTHAFRKPPAILGHEMAGEIVEVGSQVTGYKVGDRVTVEPQKGCGHCEMCKQGAINICDNKIAPGTPAWIGTFVEYFNAPESALHRLDPATYYEMGTLIEPFAVVIHLLEQATVKARDCLVILGAGTIGLLTLVAAKAMGFKTIICTDTAPYNREMALQLGAAAAINPLEEDVAQVTKALNGGRGADLAIVAAGAPSILDQACTSVRKKGEIGIVASISKPLPFFCYHIVANEQRVYGVWTYEHEDFVKAAQMINNGLDLSPFITHKLPLEQSQQALNILSEKKENVIKVLVTMA